MASPDPWESFDIWLLPPPGSHLLLKETQEQAPTPHNAPQPFSVSGQLVPCVQPACQPGLMGLMGLLRRPSATMFSEVFFFLMLG